MIILIFSLLSLRDNCHAEFCVTHSCVFLHSVSTSIGIPKQDTGLHQRQLRDPVWPTSGIGIEQLLDFHPSSGCEITPHCGFNLPFPITEFVHVFMCLWDSWKGSSKSNSPHFCIKLLTLFSCWFLGVLCIILWVIHLANIF